MDARIIFLITTGIILVIISFLHWLYTEPVDFRDWIFDEFALFWILGTLMLAGIVFGFIFWSWWIMLIIVGGLVVVTGVISVIIYIVTEKEPKSSAPANSKDSKKETDELLYKKLDKLIKSNTIGTFPLDSEFDKLISNILNIKSELDEINFNLKKMFSDYDYTQTSCQKIFAIHESSPQFLKEKDNLCNRAFIQEQYNILNKYLYEFKENILSFFLIKTSNPETNPQDFGNYQHLPSELIKALHSNIQPYIEIYSIENFLRVYINIKYYEKYNNYELTELFKNANSAKKKAISRIEEDKKQGWKTPRGPSMVFYVDFIELIDLITNQSNWDLFKNDFKDQYFIKSRIEELYDFRKKIAHNSFLCEEEIKSLSSWVNQIYSQLVKYKEKIKNWELK